MRINVLLKPDGELESLENCEGYQLSHKNLEVEGATANIYTKGLLVGNYTASDLLHIKENYGNLKVHNDYDTDPQLLSEVIEAEGFYVLFEDSNRALDVTYDACYKEHFKPIEFSGTYYYDLHASKIKLLNTLPSGYQIDTDRLIDGVQTIYDPSIMVTCGCCGRQTVAEETCTCRDEAQAFWKSSGEGLNSHSYTPEFKFRNLDAKDAKAGTFGIELEMVAQSNRVHPRMSPAFDSDDFLYLMHDGSLPTYGCEMACHPFSFKWYKEQQDPFRLEYLKHIGMESKTKEQCGLHIHISKSTFVSDDHFDAWYRLMTCNIRYLEVISGRSMGQYNQACHYPNSTKKKVNDSTNRTDAIANRGQTIEFRMMKGDLDRVEFGVEMLQATIEYAKTVKRSVSWTGFKKFLRTRQETYPNIISTFIDKKVPLGIFSIPETNNDWLSDFEGA